VSSAEFRHLENRSATGKADKLLRAAVSAFCALARPSRNEIAQLDDLAMPLVAEVSRATLRFAAAALSECAHAPPLLVRHLAGETADIAAPLLIRSRELRDVDLIVYIARCGLQHARVIARRENLPKPIEDLLTALRDPEIERLRALFGGRDPDAPDERSRAARDRLRAMMLPADPATVYRGLRDAALTGRPALFHTRIADALGLEFDRTRQVCEAEDTTAIETALRALGLGAEQAFLLLAAGRPARFADVAAIRRFAKRFEALDVEGAKAEIREWKLRDMEGIGREGARRA
jgi:uncharacterized protein (DUF2336 family)